MPRGKRDANQAALVELARVAGHLAMDVSQLRGLGFDVILIRRHDAHVTFVEVKQREASNRLTDSERAARAAIAAAGGDYRVMCCDADVQAWCEEGL